MSTFWKPVDSVDRNDSQKLLVNTRNKHLPLSYQRQLLPISRFKNEILYAVETYRTVILVGETGLAELFLSFKILIVCINRLWKIYTNTSVFEGSWVGVKWILYSMYTTSQNSCYYSFIKSFGRNGMLDWK